MKKLLIAVLVLLAVGGGFWWKSHHASVKTHSADSEVQYWTCPMHKFIHQDGPGKCPVCSMDLVPVKKETLRSDSGQGGSTTSTERKVKYWANPMNRSIHSDKPMKDDMGMDYVPVYEEEPRSTGAMPESAAFKGLAPVEINPFQEKMIDVKVAKVEKMPVTRKICTVGKFAGGSGDFAALASDFIAQEPSKPSGRYVVADVYALDQPFVKAGEKAWISGFGGSGPKIEGVVAALYPYDGTQSRVVRVRINLKKPAPTAIYANVEIEASTNASLAVPREAVLNTGTQSYVFVEEAEGKFTPREVAVGFKGDQYDEITKGLKEGEQVAWGGVFMLDADAHMNANTNN
jgi:hypothetical protein